MSDAKEFITLHDPESDELVAYLLLTHDIGCFYRDAGDWVPMDDPDDLPFVLESLVTKESSAAYQETWDNR